jgi:exodeoxyribonuclease VII small subunit
VVKRRSRFTTQSPLKKSSRREAPRKRRIMEQLSFEEAFAQLEATVAALQDGQLPLEQALQRYQDGMKLAQHCNELLQKAELTVQQLNNDSTGTLSVEAFEY